MLTVPIGLSDKQDAEQGVATNRLPTARRKRHDNSTINREIGARSQAACGSTQTFGLGIDHYAVPRTAQNAEPGIEKIDVSMQNLDVRKFGLQVFLATGERVSRAHRTRATQ